MISIEQTFLVEWIAAMARKIAAFFPVLIVLVMFLISGFAATALLGVRYGFFVPPPPKGIISADCAVFGQEGVRADRIHIKCGLNGEQVASVVVEVLEGYGLEEIRQGRDPNAAQLARIGERLGLSNEAVLDLVEGLKLRPAEPQGTRTVVAPPPIRAQASVFVASAPVPARQPREPADGLRPIELENVAVVPEASRETEAVVGDVVLECTVQSGNDRVEVGEIVKECGPDRDEVEELIEAAVNLSGIEDLRETFARDQEARQAFYQDLAEKYHLDAQVVAAAMKRIEESDAPGADLAARIDEKLREQVEMAVLLVRIGEVADLLYEHQTEVSKAVIAGNDDGARRLLVEVGAPVRGLADELAPQELAPVVRAAQLALNARERFGQGEFVGAATQFENAATLAGQSDPLVALIYSTMAAEAYLEDPGVTQDQADWAIGQYLSSAGTLETIAFTTTLQVASRFIVEGGGQADATALEAAARLLDRMSGSTDPDREPARALEVNSLLAALRWQLTVRQGSVPIALEGEASAEEALRIGREYGLDRTVALLHWSNLQMELGKLLGDPERSKAAVGGYEEIIGSSEVGGELWRVATSNKATVEMQEAYKTGDMDMLRRAGDTYRSLVDQHEAETDLWAHDSRRLAAVLSSVGASEGDGSALRESLALTDDVKAYYLRRGADLNWADTMSEQAGIIAHIGVVERNPSTIGQAAELMDEASKIYDPERLPGPWLRFQHMRADLQQRAAQFTHGPEEYLAAAQTYETARAALSGTERPLEVGELAAQEALMRILARNRGASVVEIEKARGLASLVMALVDDHGNPNDEDWADLADQAATIMSELDETTEEEG